MARRRRHNRRQQAPGARRGAAQRSARQPHEPPTLRVAKALYRKGEYREALRQFDQAVRQHPTNPQVLVDAARAYGGRFQVDRSQTLLQKALRLAPRRPDLLFLVGESYRHLGQHRQAERCFEKACMLSDDLPQAQLQLASSYERSHRLAESYELVGRLLAVQPQLGPALLLQARLQRRQGDAAGAETTLRRVIQLAQSPPLVIAEAWGELAQLLDRSGQYEQAWQAIGHCKTILLSRDAEEKKAADILADRFRQFTDTITREQFGRWHAPHSQAPRRLALLAGFPRSGTTLLEQLLDSHPEIVSSEEQDVFSAEIFPNLNRVRSHQVPVSRVLDELTPEEIQRQRERYVRFMEARLGEPIGDRLHLDKNPAMTLMIPVVARVFPELKVLVALRDPGDLLISCYLRYLPLNPVSVAYLSLDRFLQRYTLDMEAWQKYRDMLRPAWLEVRYEDLVKDLPSQARRVCALLGVPWDDAVLDYRQRARQKRVRSPTYAEVVQPVHQRSVGRWQNYQRQLDPVMPQLERLRRMLLAAADPQDV